MTDENLQAGPDRSRPLRSSGLWPGDGTTRNEDAAAAGARVCPCRDAGWSRARPPGGCQGPGAQPQRGRPVCEGRPCGVPGLLRAPCPAGASCASSLLPGTPTQASWHIPQDPAKRLRAGALASKALPCSPFSAGDSPVPPSRAVSMPSPELCGCTGQTQCASHAPSTYCAPSPARPDEQGGPGLSEPADPSTPSETVITKQLSIPDSSGRGWMLAS